MSAEQGRHAEGYRLEPRGGPPLRSDIIDVYIFRRAPSGIAEFLQLLRSAPPLAKTWHPVMGHVEPGESATACAVRELAEEVGLRSGDGAFAGLWALEQVHPFFVAEIDAIVLSPRFVCEVSPEWEPALNDEHDAARWVAERQVAGAFMWPGQLRAIDEILRHILPRQSLAREALRLRV